MSGDFSPEQKRYRASPQESFQAFTPRHDVDALRSLAASEAVE
jgi:hypothetical protein